VPFVRPHRAKTAAVLVHGYLVFSPGTSWSRFAPISSWLERQDCSVHAIRQSPTGSLPARADALGAALARLPADRLILVGHSMGGLAARLVAQRDDPDHRISDVVTLGTPHHGTPAAEWLLSRHCPEARICRLLDLGGLRDVRPAEMAAFNRAVPDRPDVRYHALAGIRPSRTLKPRWQRIASFIRRYEGANDGFVSARSAAWGPAPLRVQADHLELIGLKPLPGQWPYRRLPRHFVKLRQLLRESLSVERAGSPRPAS
jgi:triacylglycerol lipase